MTYTLFIYIGLLLASLPLSAEPTTHPSRLTPHHSEAVVADYDSLAQFDSQTLMESGRRHFEDRQAARALSCFYIVSERYDDSKSADEAHLSIRAMNNCGCVYKFFYYDYQQAYEYFTRAYDLCEQTGFEEFMPMVLVNLADLFNDYSGSYDSQPLAQQANEIFEHCMEQAVASKNWELMTTAFFNLANQNYDMDLSKYGVIFSDEIPDTIADLAYVRLLYQGIQHVQQGRYADARDCFQRQIDVISTPWEPEIDTLSSYMAVAHTYRLEQDYANAVSCLEKAFEMATERNITDQSIGICQQLAEVYQLAGDDRQWQHYHLLHLEMKDETHANRLASIGELNYFHELQKADKRAHELAEQKHRQQMGMFAGGAVLLVVLLMAALLWRKNRELMARNKSLYEKTQQVMKAESRMLHCQRNNRQSTEGRESLTLRIRELLENPDVICQQDFTVARLAKLVDSNTTYVSQAINEEFGATFSNVLGSFRIKEACRRMNDRMNFAHVTIEAISEGVGFKSRTTFVNAFKREVGLTPSEYLRMASQEENSSKSAVS